MCSRRLFELGGAIAVALLVAGSALAQMPKEDQKCIDQYNNKLRLVSQTAGKDYRACIKDAGKGDEANPGTCMTGDTPGKIAGKEAKVTALYGDKCTGSEPIQQGAATGNAAHRAGPLDLATDMFGPTAASTVSPGGDEAKCQDKAYQRSSQAFTAIIKGHRKCKKDGMKAGSITNVATLNGTCGNFTQIDVGSKAAGKLAKISTDVTGSCASPIVLGPLFPGLAPACVASPTALGLCLQQRTRCQVCTTLNEADGQSIACDTFDDGIVNSSCAEPPPPIGTHTCTLATAPLLCVGGPFNGLPCGNSTDCDDMMSPPGVCSTTQSKLDLRLQSGAFQLPAGGTVDISCGAVGVGGTAACDCDVDSFDPIIIPAIGLVCINPVAGCASGVIDCDGGTPVGVNTQADHNITQLNPNCTSNAACSTSCDAFCATKGPGFAQISSGCEGFCLGGTNDEDPCTNDSQCLPGGSCVGGEPVIHGGKCGCTCAAMGQGAPSGAGGLSCNLGVQINVVLNTLGACTDPPNIQLEPLCGPLSSENASSRLFHAGNGATSIPVPAALTQTGTSISCASLASSTTTGLKLVGGLGFFDSTLGDILSAQTLICQ